ncbi:MAG TPA: acyl-CoA synthetase [Ktedonobacteraceae bacterium]
MNSIVEAVFRHAMEQSDAPAILFEEQVINYRQLRADVTRCADALRRAGLQAGERVALFLGNEPAFVMAYLGTHLAGGIVVLVNTQYRQVELSHILNDAAVRFCVTSPDGWTTLRPLDVPALERVILVEDTDPAVQPQPATASAKESGTVAQSVAFTEFLASGSPEAAFAMPQSETPALIGYTSGTTGLAKGALLLHRNLLANIRAVTGAWHWISSDRLLLVLPLFHAHGLMVGMHGTLFTGGSVLLRQKFEAADVLSTLKHDRAITLFFGVPTMYVRLLAEAERAGAPARPLRLYVSGSAPLSAQLFTNFERVFGQPILERYGMTETIMNLTNPYEGERRAGTVGGPFPGQEARVVDVQTRQFMPDGEIGEIEIRGPHVFSGYWNRPEATAEAFAADGWFKTGDLGWRSSDGYYTITGRARELIISGGYNIYPREIEDVLALHPAVAEVAVIGQPDPEMGEKVIAAIVLAPGQNADPAELIAFCRLRLASYKKPRSISFVDILPRNALGKVQKHLLAAQLPAE